MVSDRARNVTSVMLQETREAPARVAELLRQDAAAYRALADHLAARPLGVRGHRGARQLGPCRDLRREPARHRMRPGHGIDPAIADHALRRRARARARPGAGHLAIGGEPRPDCDHAGGDRGRRVHGRDRQRRRLASGRGRGPRAAAARRPGAERRRDQELHLLARVRGAPDRALAPRPDACGRARAAARAARGGARLRLVGRASRCSRRRTACTWSAAASASASSTNGRSS